MLSEQYKEMSIYTLNLNYNTNIVIKVKFDISCFKLSSKYRPRQFIILNL